MRRRTPSRMSRSLLRRTPRRIFCRMRRILLRMGRTFWKIRRTPWRNLYDMKSTKGSSYRKKVN